MFQNNKDFSSIFKVSFVHVPHAECTHICPCVCVYGCYLLEQPFKCSMLGPHSYAFLITTPNLFNILITQIVKSLFELSVSLLIVLKQSLHL